MNNKLYLPLLAAILVLAGCKSDKIDPEPMVNGSDYYPIAVGDYKVYEVLEIAQLGDTSNLNSYSSDTTYYQYRETVDSAFVDESNEEIFRIFRYRRQTSSDTWLEDSVMVVKKTDYRVERTANNTKEVKLVFPMKQGKSWDSNNFNSKPVRTMTYRQLDVPYTFTRSAGDTAFANTVLVVAPTDSLIRVIRYNERYARGAGLIETRHYIIDYDDQQIGSGIIEQARYRLVKLLQYGKEE